MSLISNQKKIENADKRFGFSVKMLMDMLSYFKTRSGKSQILGDFRNTY